MMKSYTELIAIPDYLDRFNYLKMQGAIGERTFGGYRYLNQQLYQSDEWKKVRREIILRDDGCDLGHPDHPLFSEVLIHHINPISVEDVLERHPRVFDLDNLICCSHRTHNAIHYGDDKQLVTGPIIRAPNDTCPWR